MDLNQNNLEAILLDYADRIKELLSPSIWESVLLDCSKNELLILFLLYRCGEVNMSQIADYINVPLNTATGIVGRMEKKQMVLRERSAEDKRVVTIGLAEFGRSQLNAIMEQLLFYGQQILGELTPEELALTGRILDKVLIALTRHRKQETAPEKKIRKIIIE